MKTKGGRPIRNYETQPMEKSESEKVEVIKKVGSANVDFFANPVASLVARQNKKGK